MIDLMWAVYWIDVLDSFVPKAIGLFLLFFILCIVTSMRVTKWAIGLWLCTSVVVSLIPSKQTMYIMLGLYGGDKVLNSETGKKLTTLLESHIEEAIGKIEKKGK